MGYLQTIEPYYFGSVYPSILDTDTSLWLKGDNPLNTNSRWFDASPNNHILTGNATLTDNVLNGQKGYVFNGSSNYFDGGDILDIGTNSRTTYLIGRNVGANGSYFAKSLYGPGVYRWMLWRDNGVVYSNYLPYSISHTILNQFEKYKTIWDRNNNIFTHYWNDSLKGNVTNITGVYQNPYNFLIGAYNNASGTTPPISGYYLNGTICEIIFFDRLLTTDENTYVNEYLTTKYGTL